MNHEFEDDLNDDLLPEYDFANMPGGVKGKYVDRYRSGTFWGNDSGDEGSVESP